MAEKIGEHIKTLRKVMGLSQKEFGEKIGVTGSGVSSIELTGKVSNQTLRKISEVSGYSIQDIINGSFELKSSNLLSESRENPYSMIIQELKQQLKVKDHQIAFLEKQLDRVLGKSEMHSGGAAARLAA